MPKQGDPLDTHKSVCPKIPWGTEGLTWMPRRAEVGKEKYREQFVKHADRFCTCENDGPSLCIKSALDDVPTVATLGYGPISNYAEYGGPTWEERDAWKAPWLHEEQHRPTRLGDDRGSAFWSLKYLFTSAYWLPPTSGGKNLSPNRLFLYSTLNGHGLYQASHWLKDTLRWCNDMSPVTKGRGVAMGELLHYTDSMVARGRLNARWLYKMVHKSPCFLVNTQKQISHSCDYLSRCLEVRGDITREKRLYESYHGIQPLSLLSSKLQRGCLLAVAAGCSTNLEAQHGLMCSHIAVKAIEK